MLTGLVDEQHWLPPGLLRADGITGAYSPLVYHTFDGRVPCAVPHLRIRFRLVRGGLVVVNVGIAEEIRATQYLRWRF